MRAEHHGNCGEHGEQDPGPGGMGKCVRTVWASFPFGPNLADCKSQPARTVCQRTSLLPSTSWAPNSETAIPSFPLTGATQHASLPQSLVPFAASGRKDCLCVSSFIRGVFR